MNKNQIRIKSIIVTLIYRKILTTTAKVFNAILLKCYHHVICKITKIIVFT